jgi:hypothetical protein
MNKLEICLNLLKQDEMEYTITFIPEDSNTEYYVSWTNETGLIGNYPDPEGLEIDGILHYAEIKIIMIK